MQNSQIPASNCHRNLPAKAYMKVYVYVCIACISTWSVPPPVVVVVSLVTVAAADTAVSSRNTLHWVASGTALLLLLLLLQLQLWQNQAAETTQQLKIAI